MPVKVCQTGTVGDTDQGSVRQEDIQSVDDDGVCAAGNVADDLGRFCD